MRRLGLIGGMSWESTAVYYRLLNQGVRQRLGGLHSADLVLRSVDFAPIAAQQAAGAWAEAGAALAEAAGQLRAAGADALMICTNTMHLLREETRAGAALPLIDLLDVTAEALLKDGRRRPLLLGTAFTMEHGFYTRALARHGLKAITPNAADRALTHRVIYDELCQGVIRPESRAPLRDVIARAADEHGADATLLACTELGLLLDPDALPTPGYDTTALHCQAALAWALNGREEAL
ncbi:MAG: amino acid racemase [Pseudomonadota bacterium]